MGFWMWVYTEGGSYDGVNLKVSANGGAYTLVTGVVPAYDLTVQSEPAWGGDDSAQGWKYFTADLSAYAGDQIRLRFAFRSDSSIQKPGVYIDDISLGEASVIP
jgi:bacillopeptidase F (M6 metalloprotease family)